MQSIYSGSATNDAGDPEYITDLSTARGLTQAQLDVLRGDRHTRIPAGLNRPAHWLEEPGRSDNANEKFPPPPDHETIVLPSRVENDRIVLSSGGPPSRDELSTLHRELRSEITDLLRQGGIANLAPNFSRALDRYIDAVPEQYDDLDQITVGLRGEALRAKFASERSDLAVTAPEKIGYLEAILFQHGLLAAKLPVWQAFLAEHREDLSFGDVEIATISAEANAIIDTLEQDPDAFDERIPD